MYTNKNSTYIHHSLKACAAVAGHSLNSGYLIMRELLKGLLFIMFASILTHSILGVAAETANPASKSPQDNPLEKTSASNTTFAPEWRYVMKSGDNLIHFAKRYCTDPTAWRSLQALNNIKNPQQMIAGKYLRVPLAFLKQKPAEAEVLLVSGSVNQVLSDKTTSAVVLGQKLKQGTEILTGDNSKLNVQFADGSITSMGPNSNLKLDVLAMYEGASTVNTKIRLEKGRVEVQANPKHIEGNQMQVFTPTAVAGIRGTTFRVSTNGNDIRQETLEGKVALTAASKEIAVDKGFGSLAEGGLPPLPPVLLLPAPNAQLLPKTIGSIPAKFLMPTQEGAVAWLGKVSTDSKFSKIVAQKTSQGRELVLADLPEGNYFLSVRAIDQQGLEGYDAFHQFSVKTRPFSPQILLPKAADDIADLSYLFTWSAVDEASHYMFEVASDAEFTKIVVHQQERYTKASIKQALPAGQYYWRVASLKGNDQGPFSTPERFTYTPK